MQGGVLQGLTLLISGALCPFLFPATLSSTTALCLFLLIVFVVVAGFGTGLVRGHRPGSRSGIQRLLRMTWLLSACFLVTTLAINQRLAQRLPVSRDGTLHEVTGIIASLPESMGDAERFVFLPDTPAAPVAGKIRVYWYQRKEGANAGLIPDLHAGERWRLQLELRVPKGRINFSGVDAERWLFTGGVSALGYVRTGTNVRLAGPGMFDLQHWRESVLDRLTGKAGDVPAFRLLAALAIADRRGLYRLDKDVFSATGTGHLLAISGLHIGLAAAMGYYLGSLLLLFLPYGLKQYVAIVLPWSGAWLAALSYSALAGFGVSTQRALIMLSVATLVVLSRRRVHPALPWMLAMALVLAADPLAPLRAGFWFSFVAVAVLLLLFTPRYGVLPRWRLMVTAQIGISLTMAPLGMYWFQQSSLPGLFANLVAIPVISMVIVPAILLALLLLWLPGPLSVWLLTVAGHTAEGLFLFLDHLSVFQPLGFTATRVPGLAATVLAMAGALFWLLPRGIPGRSCGLLLMLPMLLPAGNGLSRTGTQTDFMDVGQGLAVLVGDRDYLLLYDTGPGNGLSGEAGWDMVKGTIQPMITARGQPPDLVVASHADLDHAGGLNRTRTLYPRAKLLANLPQHRAGIGACTAPAQWSGAGLEFRILHPSTGLPYLGNDSSCVISVTGPGLRLLLSGDISRAVEQRLVNAGLGRHAILTSPHHGSSTSSSQVFINAVKPSLVLISAAAHNRFGFPREDVLKRYGEVNTTVLNTASCGGIRITTDVDGFLLVESARVARTAIWRWPAASDCP